MKDNEADKGSRYPIVEGLISNLMIFKNIEDEINNAIINENEISDNASTALRNIRRQIISKNDAIKSKLNSIISSQSNKSIYKIV